LRLFVWLGTISYPLYLLHENIGWAVLRQLQLHGWATVPALLATTILILALATGVCYGIERPAMFAIRRFYKSFRAPPRPASS
jgi:peptidoglycan/LPS O-acetylase OafA/YrhL